MTSFWGAGIPRRQTTKSDPSGAADVHDDFNRSDDFAGGYASTDGPSTDTADLSPSGLNGRHPTLSHLWHPPASMLIAELKDQPYSSRDPPPSTRPGVLACNTDEATNHRHWDTGAHNAVSRQRGKTRISILAGALQSIGHEASKP